MFGFERLEVWQKAIEFANEVYRISQAFPHHERFGLTTQIRRSAVSISANIAEGSGRGSNKDFIRFVEIAFGSLMETVSYTTIALHQEFLSRVDYEALYDRATELSRMLSGLRNSLASRNN